MRNQPPFSCPQCGDTGLGGDKCLRCKIELLDKAGIPALAPPAVFLGHPTFTGFTNPWASWVAGIVGAISATSIYGLDGPSGIGILVGGQVLVWGGIYGAYRMRKGARIKHLRDRLQAQAARIAGAPAVTPIGQASGACHIRGRVRILKPVKGPMGTPVAAFLERRKRQSLGMVSAKRGTQVEAVTEVTVEETSACGVLMIEDETGSALIDDDAFAVAQLGGLKKDWDEPLSIVVNEGDEIEVIGRAEKKSASALPEIARQGGYRDAGSVLVFDGKPDERVLVLAPMAKTILNG